MFEIKPDLILLDIEMPGMDGFETCQHLKSNKNTVAIPIIFVTAKDSVEYEEKGLQLGAVDYITKPINPSIVFARVKTHITLKQQRDQLHILAMRDQLTGLYNRHYLMEVANLSVLHAKRHTQALSLLMIDIDHFKAINDNYGHSEGDFVLQEVANTIKAQYRSEEFVVLLDYCNLASAKIKAEKLCNKIAALKPSNRTVTISIGVAQLAEQVDEDFTSLLKRADLAMYQAKEQGRNRVEVIAV